MRRVRAAVLTMLLAAAVAAPGAASAAAAPASGRHRIEVDGALHGAGGFEFTCSMVTMFGNGTFHASGLGRGAYGYQVCVTGGGPLVTLTGTLILAQTRGGTVSGTINVTVAPSDPVILPVVITGGTQRFAHARGALTLGPIVESGFSRCSPHGPCLAWKESGPITGVITNVGADANPAFPRR